MCITFANLSGLRSNFALRESGRIKTTGMLEEAGWKRINAVKIKKPG